jgi:hypothetical protein
MRMTMALSFFCLLSKNFSFGEGLVANPLELGTSLVTIGFDLPMFTAENAKMHFTSFC